MPRIALPSGIAGSSKLPKTRQWLLNCFNNGQGQILGRLGFTLDRTIATGNCRGIFVWNGGLYGVYGTALWKLNDGTVDVNTNLGTVAGSDIIDVKVGFNHAVIIGKAESIYTLSTTDVLTDISGNANFELCVMSAHIDGRFVYIPSDGDPPFFSDVGAAGTVQATSFFDAEELPDKNNAIANLRNTLYIFGTDSVELFRTIPITVATDNPFARIQGARIDAGYIAGLAEYDDTLVFLGREKGQGPGFFQIQNGRAVRISTEQIDDVINGYNEDILAQVTAARMLMRGYDIMTWRFKDDSFGYFNGQWFELDTDVGGDSKSWDGQFVVQFKNKYYVGNNGNLGVLAEVNQDFGVDILRQIDTGFNDPEGRWFSGSHVELGVSQGLNSSVGSVILFLSRNNKEFPNSMIKNLGALGEYESKLIYRPYGGLGSYPGFMGVRIQTREDVIFDVDGMVVGLENGTS